MDTTKPSAFSFSNAFDVACPPADLSAQMASNQAPLLIDVRKNEAFAVSTVTLPGALRRDPLQVEAWAATLPTAGSVLVYCVHGHEVSQGVQRFLQKQGINAKYLQGGIEAWRAAGLPLYTKTTVDSDGLGIPAISDSDAVAGAYEPHIGKPA